MKEDLKKGREKGGKEDKKRRVIKHRLKYLYDRKTIHKNRKEFFCLARIYTPARRVW